MYLETKVQKDATSIWSRGRPQYHLDQNVDSQAVSGFLVFFIYFFEKNEEIKVKNLSRS